MLSGFDGKVWFGASEGICLYGALADNSFGGAGEACCQKEVAVLIFSRVCAQDPHLFFDKGALGPVWEHRVDVDHIRLAVFCNQLWQEGSALP